ncbi:unnamed protein product [Merluccius merluccius]
MLTLPSFPNTHSDHGAELRVAPRLNSTSEEFALSQEEVLVEEEEEVVLVEEEVLEDESHPSLWREKLDVVK